MHSSLSSAPIQDESYRLAVEDWDLLFEAVLTRLRDTVGGETANHPVCSLVLECVEILEKLRQSHP